LSEWTSGPVVSGRALEAGVRPGEPPARSEWSGQARRGGMCGRRGRKRKCGSDPQRTGCDMDRLALDLRVQELIDCGTDPRDDVELNRFLRDRPTERKQADDLYRVDAWLKAVARDRQEQLESDTGAGSVADAVIEAALERIVETPQEPVDRRNTGWIYRIALPAAAAAGLTLGSFNPAAMAAFAAATVHESPTRLLSNSPAKQHDAKVNGWLRCHATPTARTASSETASSASGSTRRNSSRLFRSLQSGVRPAPTASFIEAARPTPQPFARF